MNLFQPTPTRARLQRRFRSSSRRGALTVEVAICLPVLFLVLFGCYELSKANMLHHAAENAAYEASRAGIVPGATPQKCIDYAASVLRSVGITNFNVQVSPTTINRDTPAISVLVEIPLRTNTLLAPMFFGNNTFRGFCEMKREAL